nr:unnamed protein product [Spirometra erinaceieuropaei]
MTENGAVSEAFAVTNGVRQDCVFAPTLFSVMLMDAYRDELRQILIAYTTDGHLFKQQHKANLRPSSKNSLESQRSPSQHEAEDVRDSNPAIVAVWSSELDTPQESGAETQPLQPQLSSADTEAAMARPNPLYKRMRQTGILSIYVMLRKLQLRWSDHLVRMDEERLPYGLFSKDFVIDSHRQGSPIRRYEEILETSLNRLQIKLNNWKDLTRDRSTDRPGGGQ